MSLTDSRVMMPADGDDDVQLENGHQQWFS